MREGGGRDYTKAVMSPLSVSTRFKVCMHLSALLIVRFPSEYNIYISTM